MCTMPKTPAVIFMSCITCLSHLHGFKTSLHRNNTTPHECFWFSFSWPQNGRCMHCTKKKRYSHQLHFLSDGTSKWSKTVVPSEDFDGELFQNASSSHLYRISYWYVGVPPAWYVCVPPAWYVCVPPAWYVGVPPAWYVGVPPAVSGLTVGFTVISEDEINCHLAGDIGPSIHKELDYTVFTDAKIKHSTKICTGIIL